MSEVYESYTHGPIRLSFTGRRLLANERDAAMRAIAAGDFHANERALSRARDDLAAYMGKLEEGYMGRLVEGYGAIKTFAGVKVDEAVQRVYDYGPLKSQYECLQRCHERQRQTIIQQDEKIAELERDVQSLQQELKAEAALGTLRAEVEAEIAQRSERANRELSRENRELKKGIKRMLNDLLLDSMASEAARLPARIRQRVAAFGNKFKL